MSKFGLGQRVAVPRYGNVQGIIQHRFDSLIDPTKYGIAWLVGMQVTNDWFTEEQLSAANPPPPTVNEERPAPDPKSTLTVSIEVDKTKLKNAVSEIRRATASLRRRKPAKKSAKPKRKR